MRLNDIVLSWWFGELLLLVICGLAVAVAAVLTPSSEVVSLFGMEVPVLCTFRRLTGFDCPGCGLTRSFSFMAHGSFRGAFEANMLGPVVFTLVASQVPYRLIRIARGIVRSRARGASPTP